MKFIACGDLSGFDSDKTHSSVVSTIVCGYRGNFTLIEVGASISLLTLP